MIVWPRPLHSIYLTQDTSHSKHSCSSWILPYLWSLHSWTVLISHWPIKLAYNIFSSLGLSMSARKLSKFHMEFTEWKINYIKKKPGINIHMKSLLNSLLFLMKLNFLFVLQNMLFYAGTFSSLPSLKQVSSHETFQLTTSLSLFNQMYVCMI